MLLVQVHDPLGAAVGVGAGVGFGCATDVVVGVGVGDDVCVAQASGAQRPRLAASAAFCAAL